MAHSPRGGKQAAYYETPHHEQVPQLMCVVSHGTQHGGVCI